MPKTKDKDESEIKKKESEFKKNNAKAAMRFCKKCHFEIWPEFRCGCGGGGGGSSGSSGGSESSGEDKKEMKGATGSVKSDMPGKPAESTKHEGKDWGRFAAPALTPKSTILGIIADLVARKLLILEDNKGLCTLSIKCDFKLLTELQRDAVKQFIKEIKEELKDFKEKNELKKDKDYFVTESDKHDDLFILKINIPDPKMNNKFIEQLQSKKLLTTQAMSLHDADKIHLKDKSEKPFHPKPKQLSTKLKPDGSEK